MDSRLGSSALAMTAPSRVNGFDECLELPDNLLGRSIDVFLDRLQTSGSQRGYHWLAMAMQLHRPFLERFCTVMKDQGAAALRTEFEILPPPRVADVSVAQLAFITCANWALRDIEEIEET